MFYSDDKDKMSGRVQKLSTDLQLCREQISIKDRDNLKVNHLKIKKNTLTVQKIF